MTRKPATTVRAAVYDAVRQYPGIHLREIERQVGEAAQLVSYHLRKLAEEGFVEVREADHFSRYYPTSKGKSASVLPQDQTIVGLLREERVLHIVLLLLDEGPLTHTELVERMGIAKSTASFHLAKLAEAGVVVRREGSTKLRLADRARMYRLLLAYKPTPNLVDHFADLWGNLYD